MTGARWRKSTKSGGNGGDCVEVADNLPGVVLVRDTKDRDGGTLTFSAAVVAWLRRDDPRRRLIELISGQRPVRPAGAARSSAR